MDRKAINSILKIGETAAVNLSVVATASNQMFMKQYALS